MTSKEARRVLGNLQIYHDDDNDIYDALDMAIKSLKICAECVYFKERPHGKWILTYPYQDKHMVHRSCSLCGDAKYIDDTDYFVIDNFCPNCGARMTGEGEAEWKSEE